VTPVDLALYIIIAGVVLVGIGGFILAVRNDDKKDR